MSVWMITGCSTSLGRHLAEAVLQAGHEVIVTAREFGDVAGLLEHSPDSALGVALDVTDAGAIDSAVRVGLERFGQIDVLVNNAGYGYRSAVEEGDPADVDRLFAANFFGPVALIKAVLPGMRTRRQEAHRQLVLDRRPHHPRRVRLLRRRQGCTWKVCPDRCAKTSHRWASR